MTKITFGIKKENFSEWYDEIMELADIIDKRYPIKGMLVWKPYGYKALKLMEQKMKELLDETGHEEAYFPMLVPEDVFAKEKDFLEGFQGETFVVERTITKPLERKLLLRPTSEVVMYYMFNLWVKKEMKFPFKIYQTVNVFRYETKHTRPILRVREIVKFIEAHTAHKTPEDCERQIFEGIEVYKKFFDFLTIPYIILRTPSWDTFSGAEYNYDFFTLMPDGKAIELGSVINLGQRFSKVFDIQYDKPDGSKEYVYQTCYGVSERSLGVTLAIHGDDRGLIFPPNIAPIQVVIVPIIYAGSEEKVFARAKEISQQLKEFRTYVDDEDKNPGEKFYYWEMKGVPVRVEIGPKDVENGTVTLVRRDTLEKVVVPETEVVEKVRELLKALEENIYGKAKKFLEERIVVVERPEGKEGVIEKIPWCGEDSCGLEMEEITKKDALGYDPEEKAEGKCPICGKEAKWYLYLNKKY